MYRYSFKSDKSSLVALWLGFQAFTAMAWVQSLVGELRSRKPLGQKKKKSDNKMHHQSTRDPAAGRRMEHHPVPARPLVPLGVASHPLTP